MNNRLSTDKYFSAAIKKHPIFRACFFILIPLSVSLLLGISFFLIAHGVVFGFLWLSPYWPKSFGLIMKLIMFPSTNGGMKSIPITWWRVPVILLKGGVALAMIYAGFVNLFTTGFLRQNLIWLLFK